MVRGVEEKLLGGKLGTRALVMELENGWEMRGELLLRKDCCQRM
jgi:hypothetical protein